MVKIVRASNESGVRTNPIYFEISNGIDFSNRYPCNYRLLQDNINTNGK